MLGDLKVPQGFTGAPSPTNTLTPFSSNDILQYDDWEIVSLSDIHAVGCLIDTENEVASGTITVLPEIFDDGFENPE